MESAAYDPAEGINLRLNRRNRRSALRRQQQRPSHPRNPPNQLLNGSSSWCATQPWWVKTRCDGFGMPSAGEARYGGQSVHGRTGQRDVDSKLCLTFNEHANRPE